MPTQFALAPLNPDAEEDSRTDLRAVARYARTPTPELATLRKIYALQRDSTPHPSVREDFSSLLLDLDVALALRHWSRS